MFLREKEKIQAIALVDMDWLDEAAFTEVSGFSCSYFHKIVNVFKSAGTKDIKFEKNPETNREKVFARKSALVEYLTHQGQRTRNGKVIGPVSGTTSELLAQLQNDFECEQLVIKTIADMAAEIKKASALIEHQKNRLVQVQQHKRQLINELLRLRSEAQQGEEEQ